MGGARIRCGEARRVQHDLLCHLGGCRTLRVDTSLRTVCCYHTVLFLGRLKKRWSLSLTSGRNHAFSSLTFVLLGIVGAFAGPLSCREQLKKAKLQ